MFDWIIIAICGGVLAAGCAGGSALTKLLQRLVFGHKGKTEAVKEAVNAQDVEASREGHADGMEDLLFDEKLRLLVAKENLKKKLLKQKQIIQQLMSGGNGNKESPATAAGPATLTAAGVGPAGDKDGSDGISADKKSDRQARAEAEVEYFASELELSKWQN